MTEFADMYNFSNILNVKRYVVLISASVATGILFARGGRSLVSFLPALLIFAALFSIVFILIAKCEDLGLSPFKIILVVALAAAGFSLGALRFETYENAHLDSLAQFEGKHVYVYGIIASEPEASQSGYTKGAAADLYKIESADGELEVSDRIMLYFSSADAEIHSGDSVYGIAELSLIPTYDDFDYRSYMKQKGIFYSGYSKLIHLDSEYTAPRTLKSVVTDIGWRLNASITAAVDKNFSHDSELGAILKGITIGDKSGFSDEMREDFSRAGISHIAAVSGMHVSILFSALILLFGFTRLNKRVICVITVPILIIFAAAASFTPSVCRAVIMLILFLLSYALSREPDSVTSLFFAGGVMLMANPNFLFGAGFLLSFSSTLTILCLAPPFTKLLTPVSKIPFLGKYLQNSLAISISAFLGVCIPSAYFFNILSPASIIVNIWVIPMVYLIFCGGFAMWLAELVFSPAAVAVRFLIEPFLAIIKSTSVYFSEAPLLSVTVPAPSLRFICFYFGALFAFYVILKNHTSKVS